MKKLIGTLLISVSLLATSITGFAAGIKETETRNYPKGDVSITAYVHDSSRTIANDGSYGYTKAWTFDGTKIYYLKATMKATYSNGQVNGGTSYNTNTSNQASVESGYVYENGPKRQYHSSSEAKNTSSSSTEYRSGDSKIFD